MGKIIQIHVRLVARMARSPRLTDRSFPDTPLRRNLRVADLENGVELCGNKHTDALLTSRGVRRCLQIITTPRRSRDPLPASFAPSRTAVTAVTAGAPWRREWTKLRDNGRV